MGKTKFYQLRHLPLMGYLNHFGEEELGETMDKLESFINTPINVDEVNLDDYNDLSISEEEDDVLEVDLEEIKADINKSIGETLSKYFK